MVKKKLTKAHYFFSKREYVKREYVAFS